jgi:probable blue pigment (indigoidine) exporter
MTTRTTVTTALAPMVWGTTYLVTTELLPAGHPLFAGLLRALPAGLLLLLVLRVLPQGVWWWRALVLGALNIGFFFPLLFIAAERLPGGVAATVGAVQPLLVVLLALPVLGERPTLGRTGWALAGAGGVALVVLTPQADLDPAGLLAGAAAALSMAAGIVLTRRWGRPEGVSSPVLVSWLLTAGGLVLLPLTALLEGAPATIDAAAAGGYLWLGVVGGLAAYLVWFRGLGLLPVTSTALLGLLSPVVAAGLGWLVLDQALRPVQLLGFAVALVAIVGGQHSGQHSGQRSSAASAPDVVEQLGAGVGRTFGVAAADRLQDRVVLGGHRVVPVGRVGDAGAQGLGQAVVELGEQRVVGGRDDRDVEGDVGGDEGGAVAGLEGGAALDGQVVEDRQVRVGTTTGGQ